jgi:hypothetical protein
MADQEMMDYPEFIARVTSYIPSKGRAAMIRKGKSIFFLPAQ